MPATLLEAGSDEHLQEAMPCSPGRSFLQYTRGECDAHREWAFSEQGHLCEGGNSWRLARTPDWKYVYGEKGDMLFDMQVDPFETNNLVEKAEQGERVKEMRGLLIKRMGSLPIPPAPVTSNMATGFYKGILG